MGNIKTKLLLAYVNTCRPISCFDKELHGDFFFFKIILEEECHFQLDLDFELADSIKGKVKFEREPFSEEMEMLVLELLREGWLTFREAGTLQITKEGYQELMRLCKIIDPMIPSVRYMLTRLKDYRDMYDPITINQCCHS